MSKKELRDKYDEELPRLRDDIESLEGLKREANRYIPMLVTLATEPDKQLAETVIDYNTKLEEVVDIQNQAIGCGCSVSGIGVTVGAADIGVSYKYYDVAKASMENLSGGGYTGDDPYGDNGTISLTSGSGSSTTINTSNLGKGVDSFVGSGSSVAMRVINNDPLMPSSCSDTCSQLEAKRQAALTAATNAQGGRTSIINKSDTFKDEIKEYEIQVWAASAGQAETQAKIDRIETFYPNIEGD